MTAAEVAPLPVDRIMNSIEPEPTPTISPLTAWLSLGRISNLPTIWTHVLVGMAIAAADQQAAPGGLPVLLMAGSVISLLYLAGMVLNDAHDAPHDRKHKPGRPIPSGAIQRSSAFVAGYALVALAIAVAMVTSPNIEAILLTLVLAMLVLLYSWTHLFWQGSVLLLALCRVAAILTAAAFAGLTWAELDRPELLVLPGMVGVYILGLSLVARREDDQGVVVQWWAVALVVIAPWPALWIVGFTQPFLVITLGILLLGWTLVCSRALVAKPPQVGQAVSGWLAGLCLLDAFLLAALDQPLGVAIALPAFVLTRQAHVRIAGT